MLVSMPAPKRAWPRPVLPITDRARWTLAQRMLDVAEHLNFGRLGAERTDEGVDGAVALGRELVRLAVERERGGISRCRARSS